MTTYASDFFESSTDAPIQTTTINISLVTEDPVSTFRTSEKILIFQGKGSLILNESITDLNVTTTEYIPIVAAATAFASLIAIGIISVSIFVIVLIRGRKRFQEVSSSLIHSVSQLCDLSSHSSPLCTT